MQAVGSAITAIAELLDYILEHEISDHSTCCYVISAIAVIADPTACMQQYDRGSRKKLITV